MPRRGSRPSLYEVGRTRLDRTGQGLTEEASSSSLQGSMTAGQSVRLPFGFIALFLIIIAVLVCVAWWVGRGTGAQEVRSQFESDAAPHQIQDPLQSAVAVRPAAIPVEVPPVSQSDNLESSPPPEAAPKPPPKPLKPISGQYHFVLIETRPEGAERVARFCRDQGLEVAVVPGHNTRLAKVIALPGLPTGRSSDPQYGDLDARIEEVGRLWRQSGGRTSFEKRYTLKYKGD